MDELLVKQIPNLIKDSFLPSLVDRLESLDRAGFDATSLVQSAAAKAPLPDDHPAAALWWRILDELPHAAAKQLRSQPPPARAQRNQTQTAAISSAANATFNHRPEPLNRP